MLPVIPYARSSSFFLSTIESKNLLMKYLLIMIVLTCIRSNAQELQPPETFILHPPQPVTVFGKTRLVYELHFRNNGNQPVNIHTVSLIGVQDQSTLIAFSSSSLASRMGSMDPESAAASLTLQPGAHHMLYIEADLEPGKLQSIFHEIMFSSSGPNTKHLLIRCDTLHFNNSSTIVLSQPLRGGKWTAIYDPAWQRGHRRVFYAPDNRQRIPGRFAIDFIKVDTGDYANGEEDKISNWYGYGAEVLAVADGIIAAVRSDFPESPTLSDHPSYKPDQATGNYISLEIGDKRFVFYEHLQPGSLLVKEGQRVKKGQPIARLGFTGQTTGPHLHLHLADANSPLGAEGIPFVFDQFELLGSFPDFNQFGKKMDTTIFRGKREKEFPPSNSVLRF